jgi:hypothetical protein
MRAPLFFYSGFFGGETVANGQVSQTAANFEAFCGDNSRLLASSMSIPEATLPD